MSPLIALVLATIVFIWYWRKLQKDEETRRRKGLKVPPGPKPIPILGNMHQLDAVFNKKTTEWSKQYGDIYQAWLGNRIFIVISNPKWTKEIFSMDVFSGRPFFRFFDLFEEHPKIGIGNSEGHLWETHRRFLLRQLRDFGFGKSSMETRILDELNELISRFKASQGKPVGSIKHTLVLAVVNSLWSILTSERFQQDDPKLSDLALNTTKTFNEVAESSFLLTFMPWIRHIAPEYSGYKRLRDVLDANKKFFWETIIRHKQNFQEDDLKDFIDVYLAEVRKTEDPKSPFYGELAEKQLAVILFDLFLAGGDTTATTLSWAILYLCMFQEAQRNLQKEIEEVTGGNLRKVSVSDRRSMPYTQALIDEILRFSSLVADGLQHAALADSEFQGYFIPKDAMIQPNLYYIHHDPKIWGDPEKFRPERFLTEFEEYGKTKWKYARNENLQPFQVGRRQCAGESLARDTIFLYVTNLFQQFDMEFDKENGGTDNKPSLDSETGFTRSPLPFWVIMKDRLVTTTEL